MTHILCVLWAFLLGIGLALLPLPLWSISRRKHPDALRPGVESAGISSPILYLTPMCMTALGPCAHPAKLRRMAPDCIGRLLERFPFPPSESRPSQERYSSWPKQAQLLCNSNIGELHALQAKLVAEFGEPAIAVSLHEQHSGKVLQPSSHIDECSRWLRFSAILALIFLLAALVAWFAKEASSACQCQPSSTGAGPAIPSLPPLKKEVTTELSTDLIFDYNMSEPQSSVHREKAIADLKSLFEKFEGIEIRSIEAYTDPIGTPERNKELSRLRAAAIGELINEIAQGPEGRKHFKDKPMPPSKEPGGPNHDYEAFWRKCFEKYQLEVHPISHRPLINLTPLQNTDNQLMCSLADGNTIFPACARPPLPTPNRQAPAGYAQRADNLRELIACLAPMRRAIIKFNYVRQISETYKSPITQVQRSKK